MKNTTEKTKGIGAAFGPRKQTVYVVNRHGRQRRFLSRSSALNNLVHVMVQFVFDQNDIATHENGYERPGENGGIEFSRGELTERYWNAHHRTYRRIMNILARKRAIDKWKQRYDSWARMREELMEQKPF